MWTVLPGSSVFSFVIFGIQIVSVAREGRHAVSSAEEEHSGFRDTAIVAGVASCCAHTDEARQKCRKRFERIGLTISGLSNLLLQPFNTAELASMPINASVLTDMVSAGLRPSARPSKTGLFMSGSFGKAQHSRAGRAGFERECRPGGTREQSIRGGARSPSRSDGPLTYMHSVLRNFGRFGISY
jgi:hypothetical protein